MQDQDLKFFAQISKVDEDQRMVYGYASTTSLDSQNERVSKSALEKALPEYMRFANIREMHQSSAVGVAETASIDENGLYLGAKIIDDSAWNKVKTGVYKGFSIGGKCISKVDQEIRELKLSEISLVDRPANPECIFDLFKADGDMNTIEKVEARDDVNPEEGKEEYGDVKFADEKNKKYPIDTEEHVRAAWNYINKEKNAAKYDAEDLKTMKGKIVAAWKELIDDKGPPSEAEKAEQAELRKGMYGVARLAMIIEELNGICCNSRYEEQYEQDSESMVPDMLQSLVSEMGDCLKEMVAEELKELAPESTSDEGESVAMDSNSVMLSEQTDDVSKAGARHSSADMNKIQAMHDAAIELGASCISNNPAASVGAPMAEVDPAGSDYNGDSIKSEQTEMTKLDDSNNTIEKLSDENTELKKRLSELENTVIPPKGVTKVVSVSKEQDIRGSMEKAESEPLTAADAIKRAHRSGASFIIGG